MNIIAKLSPPANSNPAFNDASLLVLRLFVGLTMALSHGLAKLPPSPQLVEGLASMGFPLPDFFAWCAALAEALGGFLLAVGLLTRPAALFMGITMAVAVFVAHGADPFQKKELALMYLVVAIFFTLHGAGKFSADFYLGKRT